MKRLIVLCLASLLSSCVTFQPIKQARFHYQTLAQRLKTARQHTTWQISGAFSLKANQHKPILANYTWQQKPHSYTLLITAPLDLASLKITGTQQHVTLWLSNKQHVTANNIESLMQETVGWQVPISNLYYWIRALPAPGKFSVTTDHFGHLHTLTQPGWHITFDDYRTVHNLDLPQLLQVKGHGMHLKLRVYYAP